jgi:ornithine cyclodeaminase/alanine dehydrogenase-like protein (mu-crystallin family)
MKLLVLSAADVRELLGEADCVAAVRAAFIELAAGRADQPLRTWTDSPAAPGPVGLMPAYLPGAVQSAGPAGPGEPGEQVAYGLKVIAIKPANAVADLDTHLGVMLLADARTGEPLAVLNASALTEIRTAAVSVLATEVLARPGAGDLAVIGTGPQARAHVLAFSKARPLRRIRIAGRDQDKAAALAASLRPHVDADLTAAPSVPETVTGADIIVTVTSSRTPVLRRDWIQPGAHINAVGASQPAARELDGATIAAAALFADSRAALLAESGDYLLALADGLIGPGHLRAELGEVLTGAAGRASDTEITVFKSLGLAIEDLAAALLAYQRAASIGSGQWTDF